jgi:hypothetical protein
LPRVNCSLRHPKAFFAAIELLVACLLPIATFARVDPSIKKSALHRAACRSKGCTEVPARDLLTTATKLKLARRRKVEWVRGEAVAVPYRADLFESTFRAVGLCNGDGAVERDDRGGTYRH